MLISWVFFLNPEILFQEKLFVFLLGPLFPGISNFSLNGVLCGVGEIEGIKLIIKKGAPFESKTLNPRVAEILKDAKIKPITTPEQLFTNLVLACREEHEDMRDIENGELVIYVSTLSNLVVPDKTKKLLIPTKHFKPFSSYLEINQSVVKFKSFSFLNNSISDYYHNLSIIPSTQNALEKEGVASFRLFLSQATKNGKHMLLPLHVFTDLNSKITPLTLHDLYNNPEHSTIESIDKTQLLLTDGSQKNPLNEATFNKLKLQLKPTLIIKDALGLEILSPHLEQGQGDYETIFKNQQHCIEIKVESTPEDKQEVEDTIKEILIKNKEKLMYTQYPVILSFTFPNFSGEFLEKDLIKIQEAEEYKSIKNKVSLLTITQFKS